MVDGDMGIREGREQGRIFLFHPFNAVQVSHMWVKLPLLRLPKEDEWPRRDSNSWCRSVKTEVLASLTAFFGFAHSSSVAMREDATMIRKGSTPLQSFDRYAPGSSKTWVKAGQSYRPQARWISLICPLTDLNVFQDWSTRVGISFAASTPASRCPIVLCDISVGTYL